MNILFDIPSTVIQKTVAEIPLNQLEQYLKDIFAISDKKNTKIYYDTNSFKIGESFQTNINNEINIYKIIDRNRETLFCNHLCINSKISQKEAQFTIHKINETEYIEFYGKKLLAI